MNAYASAVWRHGRWTYLVVVLTLTACRTGRGEEISTTKPYADLIGKTYRVVGELYAYGVYGSLNTRTVDYITLILRAGISGPEYAFRREVPEGEVITILSAWQQFIPFESGVYYLVALENSGFPDRIPVRLALRRGNEGIGADLNAAIYRKAQVN